MKTFLKSVPYTLLAIAISCMSIAANADAVAAAGGDGGGALAAAIAAPNQSSANINANTADAIQGQHQGQGQSQGSNNGSQGQQQGVNIGNSSSGFIDANGVFHPGVSSGAGSGMGNNNSRSYVTGSDLSKAIGNAYAPALTTTLTETCMGSTSVGGGFSGGSFSFGTTWRDSACVRRLDAREIKSFGDIQAAKEIMCDSDLVREAFQRVGRPCAEDGGSYVAVSHPVVVVPSPVVEAQPAAVVPYTDKPVRDDQDLNAQDKARIMQKADEGREAIRTKYGF